MVCSCLSYNRPQEGQTDQSVIAVPPIAISTKDSISIDKCIHSVIGYLWNHGVLTQGCCCGHNKEKPSVVIESSEDPQKVLKLIAEVDDRKWTVLRWELISHD